MATSLLRPVISGPGELTAMLVISLQVRTTLADEARKEGIFDTPEIMFNYFIERVRSNLHIILCMSPVGDPFR